MGQVQLRQIQLGQQVNPSIVLLNEILIEIVKHAPRESIPMIALVCKRFLEIISSKHVHSILEKRQPSYWECILLNSAYKNLRVWSCHSLPLENGRVITKSGGPFPCNILQKGSIVQVGEKTDTGWLHLLNFGWVLLRGATDHQCWMQEYQVDLVGKPAMWESVTTCQLYKDADVSTPEPALLVPGVFIIECARQIDFDTEMLWIKFRGGWVKAKCLRRIQIWKYVLPNSPQIWWGMSAT